MFRIKSLSPETVDAIGEAGAIPEIAAIPLGHGALGLRGVVVKVGAAAGDPAHGVPAAELERRLLEIGFVEGARVEILHEGIIRRDPIAVRLDDMRVALRRREADAIMVRPDIPAGAAR